MDNSPQWHESPNIERIKIAHGPHTFLLLNCQIFWAANSTGERWVRLLKNGVVTARTAIAAAVATSGRLNLTKVAKGDANDYWVVEVHQTSGSSLDIDPAATVFAEVHLTWGQV
jgi:hypothetical protein